VGWCFPSAGFLTRSLASRAASVRVRKALIASPGLESLPVVGRCRIRPGVHPERKNRRGNPIRLLNRLGCALAGSEGGG